MSESVQEILAAEIRSRLTSAQIRQCDLAADVGISEKHLSQMLTGRSQGKLSMWDKLLAALPAPVVSPEQQEGQ